MEKIPAAIVGLGRIASLLEDDRLREKPCTHAGAIAGSEDCVLAAGADIDGERRALFAGRWGCPVYADAGAMLRAHAPRILHIATHPDSHLRYCELAAACGVPVVVCEKPLADKLRDARKIAALHHSGRLTIITNHERRYSADYMKARAILSGKGLGRILSAGAHLYMGKNKRLLDVLWHDGTHLADALMFLSGAVMIHQETWGAKLKSRGGTAFLGGRLVYPEPGSAEIPFLIELGAERDHLAFEMEFSCERGRLRIGNGIFEVWESGESPYAEGFRSLKKTEEGFGGPTGYFANMQADAAACARDPSRRPRSHAVDGLRVIEYLHSVRRWV
ncbi:MAG: Gfo/Idh/MocA family oxidoreductase [Spirochaetaceae bacterium]|jgi:predicted dehydrogenase|nr:Gfo/Idh/MocA family oxidoreductase [Spirochaetaceae bacterium]